MNSIATTGTGVYSFGNNTPTGSSLTDYLLWEAPRRDTTVVVIDTTPEEEQQILDYLAGLDGKPLQGFPYYPDNCTGRVSGALNSGGIPYPELFGDTTSFPSNLILQSLQERGGEVILIPNGTTNIPSSLNEFNPSIP